MEWFERLKIGLMISHIKGDIRQPHNEAMGNVAKGYSRWQTASSYFYDIERILLEMKMSRSLRTGNAMANGWRMTFLCMNSSPEQSSLLLQAKHSGESQLGCSLSSFSGSGVTCRSS